MALKLLKCTSCGYYTTNPYYKAGGECPNCGVAGFGLEGGDEVDSNQARTQKGIGLGVLRGVYPYQTLQLLGIAQKEKDLSGITYPAFARPAPSTPKHGYIDSRVVKDEAEAKALLKEVLADDPKGELLLCGFVKATYNAIWTPGSLVIGKGHDGATAGKSTITVPLAGRSPFDAETLKAAKVSDDGWPYVEAVIRGANDTTKPYPWASDGSSTKVVLTQLRAGPKIDTGGGDYIPALTEVQKVLVADAKKFKDRDWEVLIDSVAGEKGVVVWHPGGAMTDHFSIHAFSHKIPIIFGPKPEVGQVLEPIEGHDREFDPDDMLLGLIAGEKFKLSLKGTDGSGTDNTEEAVCALLVALHNATACTGEGSKWIGFGAAIMLRLGVTALRGEARHLGLGNGPKAMRQTIYKASLPHTLSRHRAGVNRLVNIFRYGNWRDGGSFGGIKWAACGAATVGLFNAVRDLARDPSEKTAAALVRSLNTAVNQAHNGGWWLNKFCNGEAFNEIQKANLPWVIATAPTFYVAGRICERLDPAVVKKAVARFASWPETTLKPPKVSSVQLTYEPGINAVGLKISSRLLGAKGKMVTAAPDKLVGALDAFVGDCTYLVETNDGYLVEIRHPEKGTFTLWQDDSLAERAVKGQLNVAKGG